MRPIVILDTNVIYRDWYFKSPDYKLFIELSPLAKVFIPSYVVKEAVANFKSSLTAKHDELVKIRGDFERQANYTGPSFDFTSHLNIANSEYESMLLSIFSTIGAEIVKPPSETVFDRVAEKAIAKTKPFKPGGAGVIDALIWEAVLEVSKGNESYFITADNDFYSTDKKSLHPVLKEEAQQNDTNVIILPAIGDFCQVLLRERISDYEIDTIEELLEIDLDFDDDSMIIIPELALSGMYFIDVEYAEAIKWEYHYENYMCYKIDHRKLFLRGTATVIIDCECELATKDYSGDDIYEIIEIDPDAKIIGVSDIGNIEMAFSMSVPVTVSAEFIPDENYIESLNIDIDYSRT